MAAAAAAILSRRSRAERAGPGGGAWTATLVRGRRRGPGLPGAAPGLEGRGEAAPGRAGGGPTGREPAPGLRGAGEAGGKL